MKIVWPSNELIQKAAEEFKPHDSMENDDAWDTPRQRHAFIQGAIWLMSQVKTEGEVPYRLPTDWDHRTETPEQMAERDAKIMRPLPKCEQLRKACTE